MVFTPRRSDGDKLECAPDSHRTEEEADDRRRSSSRLQKIDREVYDDG